MTVARISAITALAVTPDTGDFISVVGRSADAWVVSAVAGAMSAAAPLRVETLAAPAGDAGDGFSLRDRLARADARPDRGARTARSPSPTCRPT